MKTGPDTIPLGLETARLYLRAPLADTDARVVNESIRRSHEELKRWLPFAQDVPTLSETEANLQRAQELYGTGESFRYLIFLRETGTFVGTVSLFGIDWDVPKAEIGYWLDSTHTGRGYMTEAVEAVVRFGCAQFDFKRIEIRCESTNEGSRLIPERLGFQLEGMLRNEDLSADGMRLTDTAVYGLLPGELRRLAT
ncbi:MAG: GNAT family N-acetyltransferase [Exiguobacterium chiriqhucha]|uniref:GNAT family N-acetyltransferase n=1 Tax=Exiguobacterium chiriqhucha TaxID=1385984 RepID=UPI00144F6C2E|nr:GNAT family N-acetyltransferase [Exiguobacterium chiriqhucha]KAB2862391.1 MAG: GNAT family N-acetyltransferase [Exiguobacterium chiriqhucha]